MLKLKCSFLVLAIFMVAGLVLTGDAHANPVCDTLEECRSLRTHLHEKLVEQDSQDVRKILVSHLVLVNTRIEELLGQPAPEPDKRTTNTGFVFTRDRSHAELNEAWRDPDGLIWGDVKKADGTVHYMNQSDATNYCTSIGARLPSKDEFTRLREYMGARSGTYEGYSAQILPNLSGYRFWSSSVYPDDAGLAYGFNGSVGDFNVVGFRNSNGAVRCVVGR